MGQCGGCATYRQRPGTARVVVLGPEDEIVVASVIIEPPPRFGRSLQERL